MNGSTPSAFVGRCGRSDLAITEISQDFQYLAPGRELPTAAAFVIVHRLHEFNFVRLIISLTGGGVDLSSSFGLSTSGLPAIIAFIDRWLTGAAIGWFAAKGCTTVNRQLRDCVNLLRHASIYLFRGSKVVRYVETNSSCPLSDSSSDDSGSTVWQTVCVSLR